MWLMIKCYSQNLIRVIEPYYFLFDLSWKINIVFAYSKLINWINLRNNLENARNNNFCFTQPLTYFGSRRIIQMIQ
jgi:hypothetical protein